MSLKNTQESIALPDFAVTLVSGNAEAGFTSEDVTLGDYLAKHSQNGNAGLVLYFYPKDNTAGCSVQAEDFTAHAEDFARLGYQIIGVSRDGVKSHQNFITKKSLGIALISDTDEKLCQHFDVIKEKMMYGKTHLGVVRSTFVFDASGVMTHSFRNVKAKEHITALLAELG
ncbi:peroxiredoxin [Moraxella caviae]|uniref:thioredoxin-dependent peroxiredoxin n=1 Tax=Moraxella caviae TaxID=34060 RepID=A0A1S9ZYE6_9GAMM|nr:peroxiredoxin [Moraxella caviae]OOR88463.1 peroxiredoxin [Moraxella caviae]STZ14349.1 Putative peroxiredoxin bcp [Moraxella caviae]VEW10324.1 Putative peroxiredoxin bcp [Moraxella caviae]